MGLTIIALPAALLASATAFPAMLFERALPIWPTAEKLAEGMEPSDWYKRPYHFLKNITSECVRADAQYWAKLFCFVVLIQALWLYLK